MNDLTVEYWKLLNDFEDLVTGPYRRDHSTMPQIRARPSGSASPSLTGEESLDSIAAEIHACRACGLSSFRKNSVPGEGNPNPRVLIIGEGPGAQEDESGKPFVGRAGQYLDKWIEAIGLSRERSVFITNVVKCRPPENRDPEEGEMRSCFPYLLRQIALLKPEAILCLGRYAGRRISGLETSLSRLRGETYSFEGIPVIVTYHPSAVLRNADLRRPVWEDLQRLKRLLQARAEGRAAMYAEVVLNLPLKGTFSYSIPEGKSCEAGCRVEVNFSGRKTTAFVVALREDKPEGDFAVKPIGRLIDSEPIFGDQEIELARWTAQRYFSSLGEALGAMLPGGRQESALPSILPEDDIPLKQVSLSDEQEVAIQEILSGDDKPVYLYGITGSGKTEVYLQAAAKVLSEGREVIYLVPEISLTHQIVAEARSRFGEIVSVWHSRITPSQRLKEWRRIRSGEARLVIGARSAVFAPLKRIGLIIIDEEHEGSYKSGSNPRYHARQIALHRAAEAGASLVMGSATPSVEAVSLMEQGVLKERKLSRRLAGGSPPEMKIIDMRNEKGIISSALTSALRETIAAGRQAILFLNRRGFSYYFHCKSCGYEMRCDNCSVSLTFHKSRSIMLCHYCGYRTRPVEVCPDCGSLDVGTQATVRRESRPKFPPVFPKRVWPGSIPTPSHEKEPCSAY